MRLYFHELKHQSNKIMMRGKIYYMLILENIDFNRKSCIDDFTSNEMV